MDIADSQIITGFLVTMFAGLATGIGSCIAFFSKRSDTRFLACSLGFSGGVMIYISLVELLASAHQSLGEIFGHRPGSLLATAAFFGGIAVAMLIDKLVPGYENPHEVRKVEEMDSPVHHDRLVRSGMLFALAIAVHNFPEGMAAFTAALTDPVTGISIGIAIAIHNIPEGITVSVPIYHATGSRMRAFLLSFLSGLAEPLGALTAWLFLLPFLSPALLACVFAAVAGIMVFISFDELLPLAEEYGEHHLAILGVVGGMLIMALTLAW